MDVVEGTDLENKEVLFKVNYPHISLAQSDMFHDENRKTMKKFVQQNKNWLRVLSDLGNYQTS